MATIDEEECVVTESLVRAHLQLSDENGEYEAPKRGDSSGSSCYWL